MIAASPHVVGAQTVPSHRVHAVSHWLPAWLHTVEHSEGQVGSGHAAHEPLSSHHDPQISGSPGANSHLVMQSTAVGHIEPHVCENAVLDQSNTSIENNIGITRKRVVECIVGLR